MVQAIKQNDVLGMVRLSKLTHATPFLAIDLTRVEKAYQSFATLMPNVRIHYAMKCNPDDRILQRVHAIGGTFEVASYAELSQLIYLGVDPGDVIFSNPVKVPADIRNAHEAGLHCFGFDSQTELDKIAECAPGADVYVRLKTVPANSEVHSEGKFGIDADAALKLMKYAELIGLKPYGIAFHVGTQMLRPEEWKEPIKRSAKLMKELESAGITIRMLDMGGGFPAHHGDNIPDIAEFAEIINDSLKKYLPYEVELVIEPGRALVGDAGVMVATVIGVAERTGTKWVHLDVGAFNGMMEALESQNELSFPLADSKNSTSKATYNLTGPSCDSQDTIMFNIELSENLAVGDKVFLYTAGAYTTSYASRFNGFDIPAVHVVH
jgi:ornithine decarboxylase